MAYNMKAVQCCLLLCSAVIAVQSHQHPNPHMSGVGGYRRALRLVVDTSVTQHWGDGQATVTETWVPAKSFYDKKTKAIKKAAEAEAAEAEEAKAPAEAAAATTPQVTVVQAESQQAAADIQKKIAEGKVVAKEAVVQGAVAGTNKALQVATGAKP